MAENLLSPHLYFIECNLLECGEILLDKIDVGEEDYQELESVLWNKTLHFSNDEKSKTKKPILLQHGWQQTWNAIRLLRKLREKYNKSSSEESKGSLEASREAEFTSFLQHLNCLSADDCKALKELFNKVLLSKLMSKTKVLPRLKRSTEKALFSSLLDRPGETHLLLNLISCEHQAFADINLGVRELYINAALHCLQQLPTVDAEKERLVNVLYSVLLAMPLVDASVNDDLGSQLYALCRRGVLDLSAVLVVTGCMRSKYLYTLVSGSENKRLLRHIACADVTDAQVLTELHQVLTRNGKLNMEELAMRVVFCKQHWVEEVIIVASHFVMMQDDLSVQELLSFPALWPALAIYMWKQLCSKPDVLDIMLPIIAKCHELYPSCFAHLHQVVSKLKVMTDWLRKESDRDSLPDMNAMLSLTHNHSSLYVLQNTTNFVSLDHDKLHHLLVELEGPDSWNVQVFEGFTIIFKCFQVLQNAVDIFNSVEKEEFCWLLKYQEKVSQVMAELDQSINKLEPLDFRIEILEDMFLLLFVRSEDFCEDKHCEESSPDEHDEVFIQGRCLTVEVGKDGREGWKASSLPSPLHRKTSPSRTSSSSYPSTTTSQRKHSGHNRRTSRLSSLRLSQGFVVYPRLAGDILSCIQRSLDHIETNCDIQHCDRFSKLKDHVEDASWRLCMIASDDLGSGGSTFSPVTDEHWVFNDSSDSDNASLPPSSPSRKKKKIKKQDSSRSESSSGRKLSSSMQNLKVKKSSRLFSTSSNLINLMLSSPASLVSYFIAKEDIERATTVVQKLNMKGSTVDVELNFLKEFSKLRIKLSELEEETPSNVPSNKMSTLKILSETATSGVLSVTLTKLMESFFAITQLPEEVGNSKGVVVLDLALSHSDRLQYSACLLNMAANYFNSTPNTPAALSTFTSLMSSVVKEAEGDCSLRHMLLDPSLPLHSPRALSELRTFWHTLEESVDSFHSEVQSGNQDLADAAFLKLAACVISGQSLMQSYQDETKHHFLNQLRFYITTLWKVFTPIIPEGTKFEVLNRDLDSLFGELVFTHNRDPMQIEAALQPLALNIVYQVVSQCTPFIAVEQVMNKPARVVLNSGALVDGDATPCPPGVVATLLTDLLNSLDTEDLLNAVASPEVHRVLACTSSLQLLDWTCWGNESQSVQYDQLFVFYVNLYNLMWLHALISPETQGYNGLHSPSACLRDQTAACVGYTLGDAGFVSLAELHSVLVPFPHMSVTTEKNLPFSLPTSDPRSYFLLANADRLSPAVQVLTTEKLDKELDARMSAYIAATVSVTDDSVSLPMTLNRFLEYTWLTEGPESEISIDDDSESSYLNHFIRGFLKSEQGLRVDEKEIIVRKEIALTISKNYNAPLPEVPPPPEDTENSWKKKDTRPEILKYLAARNPLLGTIVEKIHCIESGVETDRSPTKSTPLERQLMSEEINRLAALYDNNIMLVLLKSAVDENVLWSWFDSKVEQRDWQACLGMLSALPEKQIKSDPRLANFRCWLLEQLSSTRDGWEHCLRIEEPNLLNSLILANVDKWCLEGCVTMFHTLLSMDSLDLSHAELTKARQLKTSIQTTSKVTKACKVKGTDDAWGVVEELLKCGKVSLALQWFQQSDLINAEQSSRTLLLVGELVTELLERGQETSAQELLQQLPTDQAVLICENITSRAQSLNSVQQILYFLQTLELTPPQALRYTYLDIGVHMLNYIPWQEQEWYRELASQPELLVEQLLMSTRISTLENILLHMKERLSTLPPTSPLSAPCLDALLRRYAAKAVGVRVRTRVLPPPRRHPTPDTPTKYTPPEEPPSKEAWVGNDEVTECMCCENSVFSMFNRRHHCRRCGRVVCGPCSSHRFKVTGYGNVKVRICNDCYEYILPKSTHMDMMSGPRPTSADSRDSEPEWWLTKDLVYNTTVREEFTYTHAPSVSLCLSILKLHSEHASLLRFLLTTIESMLQLLRPISPGIINPEVDYSLLVTMIRSLLEFAKLSCSHGSHVSASDWAAVDGLVAEVDLLSLLVTSPQTCALLPTEPLRGHSALSTLRENLLRCELWTLALEVSTKAGLDYNSVWLAWGKACLKAGAWIDARDKFAHCNPHKKDTQLLSDILQILQDTPQMTDLMSRLSRLKTMSTRTDSQQTTSRSLEPRVYEECLYYLRTYGTSASMLSFYLSQDDIKTAVCMLLESPIEPQVYLDHLFLPTLKSARVTRLYSCMSELDPSLAVFKEYLRVSCGYCERHQLFNVLYQAQVWMEDHVRAAMTCVYFFKHSTRTYQDLAINKIHLDTALGHLQVALRPQKDQKRPLVMQLPRDGVVRYITTVKLQLEVLSYVMDKAPDTPAVTLFGTREQRINLASAIVVISTQLQAGCTLAAKVTENWEAEKVNVLGGAAGQLLRQGKLAEVQAVAALTSVDSALTSQVLIAALSQRPESLDVTPLIELISDVPTKINAYIECGLLKSAYFGAVKHKRLGDVQRILDCAIEQNQPRIVKLCRVCLNIPSDSDS